MQTSPLVYTAIESSGGAYFACQTPAPLTIVDVGVTSLSSSSSSASATKTSSSSVSPHSSSSVSSTSHSSSGHSTSSSSSPTTAPPSSTGGSGLDDAFQTQVWITIPSPQISVLPDDPRVGTWNAAGPFAHLFSFHAWVPTYLEESFVIYEQQPAGEGSEQSFTSKAHVSGDFLVGATINTDHVHIVVYDWNIE